jgi:lipoyl(octanoyl) transferase
MIKCIDQTNLLIPYPDALEQMETYTKQTPTVWFLQHPHVYSLGNRGQSSDIQNIYNLPICTSARGGKVTYHGPGQLIVYCFFDLRSMGKTVHDYVLWLEQIIIETLAHFGITGKVGPHPGIWVGDAKIASIGIRVQKHITSHGFALNVTNDTKYFGPIQVCGQAQAKVTTMSHFASLTMNEVVSALRAGIT